ncbi:MAG: hypothetical protein BGO13_05250 [Burkholderiales bacterium 66-5]|nr:MAG: hypothetical protein BGO13_05250 [Burkholderiales bacterium 66-5]
MKQMSLATSGFELASKGTRKRAFLDEMDAVVPWLDPLTLIAPHAPVGLAEQILAALGLLLKSGAVADATLSAAPSSTKNKDGQRDPEMRQTKKGSQWHFDMKAHMGVDADSGYRGAGERGEVQVQHPFRIIKCPFGHRKVRYKGLPRNTSQILVMFAPSNLWMVRKRILQGECACGTRARARNTTEIGRKCRKLSTSPVLASICEYSRVNLRYEPDCADLSSALNG